MDESATKSTSNEENEDDSNVITLEEFIEEETRLETDANALLGPSDDKNCTYNQGYMGRQALYACRTCRSEENAKVAGVCLACTYHCHEGHDLIELYTKRNFRCDCGNSRFKDKKCNLEPNKDVENSDNSYNHNFDGLYCTCKRPYPDPEDSVPDEMIQCIICEDWYHTRHLQADLPSEETYAEMICTDCTERLPFLIKYIGYAVTKVSKGESVDVDVIKNGELTLSCSGTSKGLAAECENSTVPKNELQMKVDDAVVNGEIVKTEEMSSCQNVPNGDCSKVPNDKKSGDSVNEVSNEDENAPHKNCFDIQGSNCITPSEKSTESSENLPGCLLSTLKEVKREKKGATFWPQNFRALLCTCTSCKEIYKGLEVSYLIDSGDTVQSYEEKGKSSLSQTDSSRHSLDRVLGMLSNMGMDRFSQAEAILNYNDLKTNLSEYLAKFVKNKKVVREEDIHEFFTQMKARKRQKLDLPFTCR